ncbi:SUKH-3 domain-containing protein [Motilimonas sp. 1_MG-2023]|uniref:SUKH-3 domain-containing protein n=1 Tax=Motilimonas sp. 1_MG-2023 TaxID=3062672 RepID=UPI0026E267E3|nr:SUKH-3 domain-containing protein [Motilimonas sp. 1_MG-2023]MDO6525461.1 SUKH-3 domain-containing protein [Motilimonas sp. 1_MG-2023]
MPNNKNEKISDAKDILYLSGWTKKRKVTLPEHLKGDDIPSKVKDIAENIGELTIKTQDQKYDRRFHVHSKYLIDFEEDIAEHLEDTGLTLRFYPIGHMSEYPGTIVIDKNGRFYHAGDELSYLGENLEEFIDATCFTDKRCWLIIGENCTTYFAYQHRNTGYIFDQDNGWQGNPNFLSWSFMEQNLIPKWQRGES